MALGEGFAKGMVLLRNAATLQLIATVLDLAALLLLLPMLLLFLSALQVLQASVPLQPSELIERLAPHLALLVVMALPVLVSGVLRLVAIYAKLIPSASNLARWRSEFGTPSKMIRYGYWSALALGILALILIAVALTTILPQIAGGAAPGREQLFTFFGWFLGGAALAVLGGILGFIGWVGFLITLFELSSATGINGFKIAAVLHIASVAVSLFSLGLYMALAALPLSAALSIAAWYLTRSYAAQALQLPPTPPSSAPL